MTLTTAIAPGKMRRMRLRRATRARADLTFDTVVLAVAATVCAAMFFQGGLEALLGAGLGAAIGARSSTIVSGALAGLFAGTLFAGFYHGALTAAFQLVS